MLVGIVAYLLDRFTRPTPIPTPIGLGDNKSGVSNIVNQIKVFIILRLSNKHELHGRLSYTS